MLSTLSRRAKIGILISIISGMFLAALAIASVFTVGMAVAAI